MEAPGKSRLIEVCLSPALLPYYTFDNSIVVVIDIFRATSSICYGFENGAQRIIPVATVEECESYRGQDLLLAAERNGEVVQGFDFGNSPFSYTRDQRSAQVAPGYCRVLFELKRRSFLAETTGPGCALTVCRMEEPGEPGRYTLCRGCGEQAER
jgi:hypothetical protein